MIRCTFGTTVLQISDFSSFHIEMITSQIAKQAALLPLEIIEEEPTSQFPVFKQILENKHRAASLCLSDAADFGASVVQNARVNLAKPHRLLFDLKNAFSGIPAILVGAGPSLEENGHLLPEGAIIFAGGHALKKISRSPHFGAIVDKNSLDFSQFDFPICMQPRAYPIEGDILMAPDSHYPVMGETFDGGWTVGNFMAAIAVYFGCHPIVCVGMDYCTRDGKKYAFEETKVEPQEDWIMSVAWLENLEKNHPETTFFNASNGLQYFTPCKLEDFSFEKKPIGEIIRDRLSKVKRQTSEFDATSMLQPLWQIWEPVFSRAGNFTEEQMRIHRDLFFQQVLGTYD
ncbi:MAG TPA: 6-hydroxymethylpterin diphosphokinase MptE-like protein [Chlamydiales bacterium]|nr:6-hydroxymethylpterin diphosphokinase MptE-like protein [Chlamydiales bacterium]